MMRAGNSIVDIELIEGDDINGAPCYSITRLVFIGRGVPTRIIVTAATYRVMFRNVPNGK